MLEDVRRATEQLNNNVKNFTKERKMVVYSLYQDNKLVYIGKSTNLQLRLSQHARNNEFEERKQKRERCL